MRPIDPGAFRNVVTYQQATETQSSVGQSLKTWNDVGPVWCSIEPLSARETWLAQQVQATTTHKITCRYNPTIQPTGAMPSPQDGVPPPVGIATS